MPVHPKIICLKLKLIRNTVLGKRKSSFFLESQIWDNRSSGSLTPDLQAILFYCRGPMGMAGLGLRELSSQLCQGESMQQRAVCVSQWQTAVVSASWILLEMPSEKASLAPQKVALRGWCLCSQNLLIPTSWQHFAAPVQTTWLQGPDVGNRSFLWHPDAVIQWPLLLLSPTQHQFHSSNRPALKFRPEFLCVSIQRLDHCCSVI